MSYIWNERFTKQIQKSNLRLGLKAYWNSENKSKNQEKEYAHPY